MSKRLRVEEIREKLIDLLEFAQEGIVISSTLEETFVDCEIEPKGDSKIIVTLSTGQEVRVSISLD